LVIAAVSAIAAILAVPKVRPSLDEKGESRPQGYPPSASSTTGRELNASTSLEGATSSEPTTNIADERSSDAAILTTEADSGIQKPCDEPT
jgi:hypothetical protein